MSSITLVVVHGCARIYHVAVDQQIRSHLRANPDIVVSFTEPVKLRTQPTVIMLSASFYPSTYTTEHFEALGGIIAKVTKCPTTVLVENRHPAARHTAMTEVIAQQRATGKLR